MPVIKKELDEQGRLVIPKILRERWSDKVFLYPDNFAIIIRPKNAPIEYAVKSVEHLIGEMRTLAEIEAEKRERR